MRKLLAVVCFVAFLVVALFITVLGVDTTDDHHQW
jgi:hypothetical protein